MQLISISLITTRARSFSLQATRPERKGSTDIMSVHCSFTASQARTIARERKAPRLISIRNNQEYFVPCATLRDF